MQRYFYKSLLILVLCLVATPGHAARVKAYVGRFAVSVTENRDELKQSLQTLLSSRLSTDEILAVDRQAEADILVEGSYIVFGDIFSLDALIKTSAGAIIDRVFIQGDSQGELIPATTEMADAIKRALGKWDPALAGTAGAEKMVRTQPKSQPVKKQKPVVPATTAPASPPTIATAPALPKKSGSTWESQRFQEMLTGIAIGRFLGDKGHELFTVGERYVRYYLKGKKLQFLSAVTVGPGETIVGVDTADLDQDGVPEIYVSIVKGGGASSHVYGVENNQLKRIAEEIPYLLRGIALAGGDQKIYGQQMGPDGGLTGPVVELVRKGDRFEAGAAVPLPRFANLYNFNRLSGGQGGQKVVVNHPDGYLLVYGPDGRQLWKSRDKFGGSEGIDCKGDGTAPAPCTLNRSQRLLVTRAGELIASRNLGLNGNGGQQQNAKKSALLLLSWDGRVLQEKWRSGQSPNYLVDFAFDGRSRELLLLEVEPRPDASGERGSRVVALPLE